MIYVDMMGRPPRSQILRADADGLAVQSSGLENSIHWRAITPRRFYGIAKKHCEDHKLLAAFCRGRGLIDQANFESSLLP